jgi:hypothetical protein
MLAFGLFGSVHDYFLRTHKCLQLCSAETPGRSHRDARRRRRRRWRWRWTRRPRRARRTRGRLGWRRLGRRRRRMWRRRKSGFEDRPRSDPGLHRARGARGDWPLATLRPLGVGSASGVRVDRRQIAGQRPNHASIVADRVTRRIVEISVVGGLHDRVGVSSVWRVLEAESVTELVREQRVAPAAVGNRDLAGVRVEAMRLRRASPTLTSLSQYDG